MVWASPGPLPRLASVLVHHVQAVDALHVDPVVTGLVVVLENAHGRGGADSLGPGPLCRITGTPLRAWWSGASLRALVTGDTHYPLPHGVNGLCQARQRWRCGGERGDRD